jgi:hypothetical protein
MTLPGFVARKSLSLDKGNYLGVLDSCEISVSRGEQSDFVIPQQEEGPPTYEKPGEEIHWIMAKRTKPRPPTELPYGFASPRNGGGRGGGGGSSRPPTSKERAKEREECADTYFENCYKEECESISWRYKCLKRCYNKYSGPFAQKGYSAVGLKRVCEDICSETLCHTNCRLRADRFCGVTP